MKTTTIRRSSVQAMMVLGALASATVAEAGVDINGGASWGGWSSRGNSLQTGVWAGQSTTRSYDIYTTVFTFNNDTVSGSPIQAGNGPRDFAAGAYSPGAFSNGNTILGIGYKMNNGARALGQQFVSFGLQGNDFQAASSVGATDGRASLSQWGHTGDFTAWINGVNLGPSNLGILKSDGTSQGGTAATTNLVGGIGSGVSYDFAFRQFRQGDVDGSVQMFFDLTAMQTLYGQGGLLVQSPLNGFPFNPGGWSDGASPIGAFGSNINIALSVMDGDFTDQSRVAFGVAVPTPGALALLGLGGLAARRRRR
ncbi:MAG: hypothetical protein NTU45_06530 [Planctomycetota bacterium]|nr:hypothetical protein [Planctomycetota bacterium]